MVDERRAALREVRAQRAAHSTEVLDWLGSRVSAFGLAVLLLLTAFLAAGWQPMVGWLALKRSGGLEAGTYAKAIAATAAAMAGGAAAVSTLSPVSQGALSPLAVPVIAAGVVFTGLLAWSASATKAGSAGVPVGLAGRRPLPGMAVVLALVVGLGIGLIAILVGEPAEERVAPKTAALARLAEPDPTARPTSHVARLRAEAKRADGLARRAEARIAQGTLGEP